MRQLAVVLVLLFVAAPLSAGIIYFPQVADGGGYVTTFTIINPTPNAADGTLRLRDAYGNTWSMTLTDGRSGTQFSVSVPPMGSTRLVSTGFGQTRTGWAVLESEADLSGVETFDYKPAGTLVDSVGVVGAPSGRSFLIPIDTSSSADTGFAIANVGASDVYVRLTLKNEDGTNNTGLEDSRLNPLPPQAYLSLFATQLFPIVKSIPFRGALLVEVTNSGSIAVMGLASKGGQLSSVPVAVANAPSPNTVSKSKAQKMLGYWRLAYMGDSGTPKIDPYYFNTVTQSTEDPTLWIASGVNQDDVALATVAWNAELKQYMLTHLASQYYDVYVFDFSGDNTIYGFYYRRYGDGSLSPRKELSGLKIEDLSPAPAETYLERLLSK